jgi:hypothetical protein
MLSNGLDRENRREEVETKGKAGMKAATTRRQKFRCRGGEDDRRWRRIEAG